MTLRANQGNEETAPLKSYDVTGAPGQGEAAVPRTVFMVEDHAMMRRLLRQFLDGEPDLRVIDDVDSAEAALIALSGLTPDLLTVDLSLPGMNGLELVRRLAEQRPELRCLVVTGHADPLYRAEALKAGAAGYVTKDDPDEVLAAVREVLKKNTGL